MKLYPQILSEMIQIKEDLRKELDTLGLEVKEIAPEYFNIETLANRGDHLSHLGIARDLAARFNLEIFYPKLGQELKPNSGELLGTKSQESKVFSILEVTLSALPRLSADIRKLVPEKDGRPALVDLLNYVQQELGQPMHAYDASKIKGRISVVLSKTPREIVGLDGKDYIVPENSLLVIDQEKIIAVAGVIGCENSMCEEDTKHVLLEAAHFDPILVRKTARAMGLSTEASYSFERGVDPNLYENALRRVLALLELPKVGLYQVLSEKTETRIIDFDLNCVRSEMNNDGISDERIKQILRSLGFKQKGREVVVPSWRTFDIYNPEDLVEEVVRIVGLDHVRSILPPLSNEEVPRNNLEILHQKLSPVLLGLGFNEIVTRSFFGPKYSQLYSELVSDGKIIKLKNSIEATNGALKPTNIFHLVEVCSENLKRGAQSAKVFEIGRVFSEPFTQFDYEREVLSIAQAGRFYKGEWGKKEDLNTLARLFIGVLEEVVASFGRRVDFIPSEHPLFDSSTALVIENVTIGYCGLPKAEILEGAEVFVAEIFVDRLISFEYEAQFRLPSDFPSIKRDVTIVGSRHAYDMSRAIKSFSSSLISNVLMVNDFTKEGTRRASYRVTFQSHERTLTNEEVDREMERFIEHLDNCGYPLAT